MKRPKTNVGNIDEEWKMCKTTHIEVAENVWGRTSGNFKMGKQTGGMRQQKKGVKNKNQAFRRY